MRVSQVRGQVKTIAVNLVEPTYGFTAVGESHSGSDSEGDDTNEATAAAIAKNRALVETLKCKAAFSRLDPHDATIKGSLYRNRIIQKVLNQQWFRNAQADGLRFSEHFSPGGCIPLATIALIMTAVECAIDGWSTGRRVTERNQGAFDGVHYMRVYNVHIQKLRDWEKFTAGKPDNLTKKLQQDLLRRARKHAGVGVVEVERPANDVLTDADFAANEA
ncbi:hypothetical protein PLICRDRAFT_52973 [Plicaturopsis crispa FD-325 SS-3]|nr:hypothetical protein PLICRDRAFT_52973 [Plicaturopsis crispa FD-325 SS-3]